MDCYYHANVPSVAECSDCEKRICATCRDAEGACPGCRLAARIDQAAGKKSLGGKVGYANRGRAYYGEQNVTHKPAAKVATLPVSTETRALLALGYPVWPLAALALLDAKRSPFVRRQALQSLGFNFGVFALWLVLGVVAHLPLLGLTAWPLWAVMAPLALVMDIVYGFKLWNGEDVRVPIVSDWLDERDRKVSAA